MSHAGSIVNLFLFSSLSRSRSQIQIASRTFHFVLPPATDGPEDSSTPSSPSSSAQRARSPSVDITSFSPPSSLPSCSPPPVHVAPHLPKIPPLHDSTSSLPNSNSIKAKANPKKRKKSDVDAPPSRPEVIPPKPQFTYAQLCYRAIKALSGRGSLQDICHWIQDNYEYYKYSDKDWEVRMLLHMFVALLLTNTCGHFYRALYVITSRLTEASRKSNEVLTRRVRVRCGPLTLSTSIPLRSRKPNDSR